MTELVDMLRDYEQTLRAIRCIDEGGKIVSMMIATPLPPMPPPMPPEESRVEPTGPPQVFTQMTAFVQTGDMIYPPQMIDMIKGQLSSRQQRLAAELADQGVTGLGRQ